MGEVEDIVRGQEAAVRKAAASQAEVKRREEEERKRRVISGIDSDRDKLLGLLKEQGYPGGSIMNVYVGRTVFGGSKRQKRAGWQILRDVYLLSDGTFAWKGWETTVMDLKTLERDRSKVQGKDLRPTLNEIADGIRAKLDLHA